MRAAFGIWIGAALGVAALGLPACASSESASSGVGGKIDSGVFDAPHKDGGTDAAKDAAKDAAGGSDAGDAGQCLEKELCDGKDNTCDGTIDEGCDCVEGDTQDCYTGNQNLVGIGECKRGTETCDIEGVWGTCEGEVLPSSEICDGKDNDCNGLVDDSLGSETCGKGACTVTTETCINGQPQTCTPKPPATAEACDGIDNTCDGTIDEGCLCLDGQTQDCYTGAPTTKNVGVCKSGKQTCAGGQWGTCQGEVLPSNETCDGKDDDCDSQTDESNPGGGATCSTGLSGVCSVGTQTCTDGALKCVQITSASPEVCDSKDNDCNGKVDDGSNGCGGVCTLSNPANSPCDGPDVDLCAEGVWTCNGTNAVTCSDNSGNNAEICNNLDDDCDGTIDEGTNACGGACTLSNAPGSACDGPDTDLCKEGTWQCSGLNSVSCTDATGNNVETCNNLDDDCDGTVDEGNNACGGVCTLAHAPGSACDGPDTDLCNEGTWQCSGLNNVTCSDTTGDNVEICDAIDQDCDGNISEGPCSLANSSSTCQAGSCVITGCNSGYLNCDGVASNGCELTNGGYSNSPPGQNLGNVISDAYGGSLCDFQACVLKGSYTGTQGRYFTVVADDQVATCDGYDSVKFVLNVPSGINYDVAVSSPNQVPGSGGCYCEVNGATTPIIGNTCTASNGAGVNDQIVLWCDAPFSSTPDFTVNVEVKYISGSSCSPWTLDVYSRGC